MSQRQFLNVLFQATVGFISGVIFGSYYPVGPDQITYLLGFIVFWLVAGYFLWEITGKSASVETWVRIGLVLSLAFLIGWARYSSALERLEDRHVSDYSGSNWDKSVRVVGTVSAQPEVDRLSATLQVTPDKIWPSPDADKPEIPSGGDILVKVKKDNFKDLSLGYQQASANDIYGDQLRIVGALIEPFEKSNPGGFSYKTFLRSQGIYGAVWSPEQLERLDKRTGNPIVAYALDLQEEMLKTIKMTMPYPHSAFLGGATLGLREALTYTKMPFGEGEKLISDVFQASGTSHVLAVSGLHVGVIAGAFLALFSGLRIPKKIYAPLILFSLLIFTILTGARPATVRASIMMGLIVLGLAYLDQGLKNSVLFGLCLSALFILMNNPKLIYEASFTLSFAAVLCLALLTGPIEQIMDQIRDLSFLVFWLCIGVSVAFWAVSWNFFFQWYIYVPYFGFWGIIFYVTFRYDRNYRLLGGFGFHSIPTAVTGFLAAQFAIQLGMMWPLSAYYFQAFPIAGSFANLIAIPLVGIVVPLGLLAGMVGLIPEVGPWLALVVNAGNYLSVTAFLWVTDFFATYLPYPLVRKMNLFHLVGLYLALTLLAFWETIYGTFRQTVFRITDQIFGRLVVYPWKIWVGCLAGGALLFLGFSFQNEPSSDALQVTVLNVGYGNGIAVRTPDENRFLINGGPRLWDWHNTDNLPERRDAGKQVIASYFLSNRIKTLDSVVAQAAEPQYIGGLPVILKHFTVDRFYGSLPKKPLTPFNKRNYLKALDNYYYEENSEESWFVKDYYRNWERLWNQIRANGIPYDRPNSGTKLYEGSFEGSSGKSIELSVLHPPEETRYNRYASSNRSLVLSLRVQDGPSFLFPGDLRRGGQEDLLETYNDRELNHDVMLVPSSGMEKSSVREKFVNSVDPRYLVFSTGTPEIKGPLASKLQNRLTKNTKKAKNLVSEERILRTDQDFAITFRTQGSELEVRTVAEE